MTLKVISAIMSHIPSKMILNANGHHKLEIAMYIGNDSYHIHVKFEAVRSKLTEILAKR